MDILHLVFAGVIVPSLLWCLCHYLSRPKLVANDENPRLSYWQKMIPALPSGTLLALTWHQYIGGGSVSPPVFPPPPPPLLSPPLPRLFLSALQSIFPSSFLLLFRASAVVDMCLRGRCVPLSLTPTIVSDNIQAYSVTFCLIEIDASSTPECVCGSRQMDCILPWFTCFVFLSLHHDLSRSLNPYVIRAWRRYCPVRYPGHCIMLRVARTRTYPHTNTYPRSIHPLTALSRLCTHALRAGPTKAFRSKR